MKTDTSNYEALYGMLRDAVCGAMSEAPTGAPTIVQRAVRERRTFADQRTELGKVRRLLFQLRQGIEHFRQAAGTVTALCVEIDANPAVTSCDIVDVVAAHDRQQEVAGVRLLRELGYEPCTAVACNCGSWHLSREGEERRDARDARLVANLGGERILCAAVFVPTGQPAEFHSPGYPEDGLLFTGLRHNDCIGMLLAWAQGQPDEVVDSLGAEALAGKHQGFLTSRGRFVNRAEAARFAFVAGQTGDVRHESLSSEDLY